MYSRKTSIINETGLHARPASVFVKEAKTYVSKISIANLTENSEKFVNAKSVVSLLSLGAGKGTEVEIRAEGEDEENAVNALVLLIESGAGE